MTYQCKCNKKNDDVISSQFETRSPVFMGPKTKHLSDPSEVQVTEPISEKPNKTIDVYSSTEVDMLEQQSVDYKSDNKSTPKRPCIDFNPCKHGICQINNKTKEFTCECQTGYMGPFCDIMKHPCDFKPCKNGVCEIVSSTTYKCLCKPNYTGENCQIGLFHII